MISSIDDATNNRGRHKQWIPPLMMSIMRYTSQTRLTHPLCCNTFLLAMAKVNPRRGVGDMAPLVVVANLDVITTTASLLEDVSSLPICHINQLPHRRLHSIIRSSSGLLRPYHANFATVPATHVMLICIVLTMPIQPPPTDSFSALSVGEIAGPTRILT